MTTTVSTNDSFYRHISISGPTLTDAMRGAADWLDDAASKLGEVLFVGAMHFDLTDEENDPWQFSLFVYEDEVVDA